MAATRNIVGDFRFEVAAKARSCDASSKHQIKGGERHFAYEKVPGQRKNICLLCAPAILNVALNHINDLVKELP